ncbi:MAG: hypothetical protein AB7N91_00120 [Candidatus Tectimicrobiota bacterium]
MALDTRNPQEMVQMVDKAYAAPTPLVLYIHDDLTEYVQQHYDVGTPQARLTQELFVLLRRQAPSVVVLTLEEQLTRVIAQGNHAPFALTLGIGQAGERVAQRLHQRTGWFPVLRRVDVTREEDGQGAYNVVSLRPQSLAEQVQGVEAYASVAVVDDTVFSGLTMRTVLRALQPAALRHTRSFCLRGVAESLPGVQALCPLTIGFAASGRLLEEVSFLNATGMVLRVGIRRAGQPPMAFFERPEWFHAWFPGYADEVLQLCQRLNALLEPLA